MNRRSFIVNAMELQRQYLLDADAADKKSSERFPADGPENRGTVRPGVPRQPQQGSMDEEYAFAGTPKPHEHQHERTKRRRLQLCTLSILVAFIIYTHIPWGSPNLSWLGTDSPIVLYAQETLSSLPLNHASDDAIRDDPMPNFSCKLHGWSIWTQG